MSLLAATKPQKKNTLTKVANARVVLFCFIKMWISSTAKNNIFTANPTPKRKS